MLKKAGIVVAAAACLAMGAGTAASAATVTQTPTDSSPSVSFSQAYHQFIKGGAALGYGAASLVAGAYTGVMTTPANILDTSGLISSN